MNKSLLLSLFIGLLLSGCSGTLYTVLNPNLPTSGESKIEGIVVYDQENVIELYKATILVDQQSGNQVGAAPHGCKISYSYKHSTRADYTKPSVIVYEPGLFETNSFSVSLEHGVLKGVNTESNPTAPLAGIAELLPFITPPKLSGEQLFPGEIPCNAGYKLVGVYKSPQTKKFEEMPIDARP